jgi:hypothetical protein
MPGLTNLQFIQAVRDHVEAVYRTALDLDRESKACPWKPSGVSKQAELDRTIADLTPFVGKRLDDLCRSLTGEGEGEWGARFLRELSWDKEVGARQMLGRIRARLESLRVMPDFLDS